MRKRVVLIVPFLLSLQKKTFQNIPGNENRPIPYVIGMTIEVNMSTGQEEKSEDYFQMHNVL